MNLFSQIWPFFSISHVSSAKILIKDITKIAKDLFLTELNGICVWFYFGLNISHLQASIHVTPIHHYLSKHVCSTMQIAVQFTISESTIIILTKANNDLINGVDLERLKIYNIGYLILKTPILHLYIHVTAFH